MAGPAQTDIAATGIQRGAAEGDAVVVEINANRVSGCRVGSPPDNDVPAAGCHAAVRKNDGSGVVVVTVCPECDIAARCGQTGSRRKKCRIRRLDQNVAVRASTRCIDVALHIDAAADQVNTSVDINGVIDADPRRVSVFAQRQAAQRTIVVNRQPARVSGAGKGVADDGAIVVELS